MKVMRWFNLIVVAGMLVAALPGAASADKNAAAAPSRQAAQATPTATTAPTAVLPATPTRTAPPGTISPTSTPTRVSSAQATPTTTATATVFAASPTPTKTATPTATTPAAPARARAVTLPLIGPEGGTVDLPGGQLILPPGALPAASRISRYAVEMRLASGLIRYHPIGQPIHIAASRNDNGTPVDRLPRPATVRLSLEKPGTPPATVARPAMRILAETGWELVPSTYDPSSMVVTADIAALPATLAVVDDALPEASGEWDPYDPAAVQLGGNAWGVAYVDAAGLDHVMYRRSLDSTPPYWLDPVTIETGTTDSPALVKLGSTLALFYRKTSGSYKQVFLRTSIDSGATWSAATQLTTETVNVYQIQASNVSGTVYVFWSVSDTSGLLQYRTSTDLSSWTTKASVGQGIGPLQGYIPPAFDVKRLASGTWALAWVNVSTIAGLPGANNTSYPVLLFATSSDLATWSSAREMSLPYDQRWPGGLGLAQDGAGTLYLGWTHQGQWNVFAYYQTSGDGGQTWSGDREFRLYRRADGSYCILEPGETGCGGATFVGSYFETIYGFEPSPLPQGWGPVTANNSYPVVDSGGNVRAFWDQGVGPFGSDKYPTQLFWRDLPSGAITPIPPAKEPLALCGFCVKGAAFGGDPVNVTTGNFTLPETDIAIPGRGLGLVFQRTYNSGRLVDGPLGFGWTHNYDTHLSALSGGEALVVDKSGRSDLYLPAAGGTYTSPVGLFTTLVHNGDGTYTLGATSQITRTFSSAGKLTGMSDRNGNSLSLSYDQAGLLSTVADPAGRTLTFAYSGGRISSVTDPLSRTVSYSYTSGDLTSVVDRRGKTWSYSYDAGHRALTKVDPNSHTVLTNVYGTLSRVVSQTDAAGGETRFEYDGGKSYRYDPLGNKTTYTFDTQYRVTQIADPYGATVYYYYDASNNLTRIQDTRAATNNTWFTYDTRGNVLTRKNQLNNIWTYTYNSLNDVLSEKDPLNHTTTYTYTVSGNLSALRNAKSEVTGFGRDGYGQLTSVTDARGKTTTFGYDTYGNVVTTTNPYGKVWIASYDLAGRKLSTTDPLSDTTSYGYDAGDNLASVTDGRGKVTSYAYDDAGNQTSATDPNLKVTAYGYDAKNRLVAVTDAISGTTRYGYDAGDNLTVITDTLSHARAFSYDKNNRLASESDALGKVTSYEYDGAGNRIGRSDGNHAPTTYSYDAINRLTGVGYAQGIVSYGYNAANLRTSMADATGTTSYGYDELNRLSSVTQPGNKVLSYQYDAAGNRTRVTYPDGKAVDYSYDDANRMSAVTNWLTKTTSYGYDDAGRLTSASLPNGVVEARSYNAADQLTSIIASKGGITLTAFSYTLDDAGLRTAVQDLAGSESYGYDNLYRLTGASYTDGITQTYGYDGVGNRQSKVESGATITYTYDAGDRLTSSTGATYGYDDNGNLISKTQGGVTTTYCYDSLDRLARATTVGVCPPPTIRVNSGDGSYRGSGNTSWAADYGYSGGETKSTGWSVSGTSDSLLYQTAREGTFSYDLGLPNGAYTVTLKFAELTYTAAGQRRFDVAIEGTQVLDDFDVYAAAGGRFKAVDRGFATTISDGSLAIAFTGVTNGATIGAIQVAPVYTDTTPDVAYTYRGDGLRYTKTVSGTAPITYTWDLNAGLPVIVQDGSYSYVYGLGLISQTDGSGNQSYFLGNALGSTEKLTDGSGNVVASYKYDVFGAVRSSSGSGWTEYRFTGQQDDAALGMTYLRARYYDPGTGRFFTRDPVRGSVRNPASQHLYVYAWNDPTNVVDLTGRETSGLGVSGSAGAGLGVAGGITIVWDDRGNVGLLISVGGGGYAAATASIGPFLQWTTACDIYSLASPTVYLGASAGEGVGVGVDALIGTNADGSPYYGYQGQVAATAKAPIPFEIHGGVQVSSIPVSVNLAALAERVLRWLP